MKPASFDTAEWIDAWRDRRPMTEDPVLVSYVFDGKSYVDTACYRKGVEDFRYGFTTEGWRASGIVLAWRPLPEPYIPEAVTNEDEHTLVIDAEGVRIEC